MRTYLVDGSNAVRRGGYDARFPDVEEARTERWLGRLDALAAGARALVEVFFDGPRRGLGVACSSVRVRFPVDGNADDAILGSARLLLSSGRGVVVVTGDGQLASEARSEGARVMGFAELEERLRGGKA